MTIAGGLGSAASCVMLGLTEGMSSLILIENLFLIPAFGAVTAAAVAMGIMVYNKIKDKSKMTPEEQEKIRNDYKNAYMKVSQENEQLKTQLAELQK